MGKRMAFASMDVFNEVGRLSNPARYRDSGSEEPGFEECCLLSTFEMRCGRVCSGKLRMIRVTRVLVMDEKSTLSC